MLDPLKIATCGILGREPLFMALQGLVSSIGEYFPRIVRWVILKRP
jgi:hypothetical protein